MSFQLPLIVILSSSLFGLFSLWAATAKLAWHVRSSVVALSLSGLLLIPAYEPILFCLIQCLVIVFGVHVATARRNGLADILDRAKFSLRSLLLVTVMMAGVLAVIARLPSHEPVVWANLVSAAFACSVVTLLAAEVAFAESRRWLSIVVTVLATPFIAGPATLTDGMLSEYGFAKTPGQYSMRWIWVLYAMLLLVTTWLMLWRQSFRNKDGPIGDGHHTARTACRGVLVVMTMLIVFPCTRVYLSLLVFYVAPGNPPNRVEGPNGYDDLVEASSLYVSHNAITNLTQNTSVSEIENGLAQNAAALAMVRKGLQRPCEQHIEFQRNPTVDRARITRMIDLAQLMRAEAELALRQRRTTDATRIYLEIIRFGQSLEYGGLLVDSSLSNIVQAIGLDGLVKLRHQLPRAERLRLVDELSDLDGSRESWRSLYDRNHFLAVVNIGWLERLYRLIEGQEREFLQGLLANRNRVIATARLLITELAITDYLEEQSSLPKSLEILGLDRTVLIDPFSKNRASFRYHHGDGGFTVYSVGADGDDDGGTYGPIAGARDGDHLLNE